MVGLSIGLVVITLIIIGCFCYSRMPDGKQSSFQLFFLSQFINQIVTADCHFGNFSSKIVLFLVEKIEHFLTLIAFF